MAAWVVFGTIHINSNSAWRIPSALQALPAIIQCSFAFVCPDSPRHLYYKGHHAEAKAMIIKYHSDGQDDDLAQWEYDEIAVALDAEQALPKGIFAPLFNALKKTGYRKRLFIIMWLAICSQASGNSFISYYLSPVLRSTGITGQLQQTIINATSQILSWLSAMAFTVLPARVGRRTLFLSSLALLLLVVSGITAASAVFSQNPNNKAASYSVVALIYLFSPCYK